MFLYSFSHLNFNHFESGFVILVGMTLILSSQISVPIPRFSSQISVWDTHSSFCSSCSTVELPRSQWARLKRASRRFASLRSLES